MLLQAEFISTLIALIDINTSPPEAGGAPSRIERAQDLYAFLAEGLGMRTVFSSQSSQNARTEHINTKARWLLNQPHRVFEIGKGDVQHTLMFNFHMDTLGPHLAHQVKDSEHGKLLIGRGVLDAKGPAIALLAAVAQISEQRPEIFEHIRIVIQMLGSAKDCAMSAQNTITLVELGLYGHLNVFMQANDARHFESITHARRETMGLSDDSTSDLHNLAQNDDHAAINQPDGIFSVVAQTLQNRGLNRGLNDNESIALEDLCRFMQDMEDLIVTFADQRTGLGMPVTAPGGLVMPMNRALNYVYPPSQLAKAANGDDFRISL
jgi:hypothetical protein